MVTESKRVAYSTWPPRLKWRRGSILPDCVERSGPCRGHGRHADEIVAATLIDQAVVREPAVDARHGDARGVGERGLDWASRERILLAAWHGVDTLQGRRPAPAQVPFDSWDRCALDQAPGRWRASGRRRRATLPDRHRRSPRPRCPASPDRSRDAPAGGAGSARPTSILMRRSRERVSSGVSICARGRQGFDRGDESAAA